MRFVKPHLLPEVLFAHLSLSPTSVDVTPSTMTATIEQLNVSNGGVPKLPVAVVDVSALHYS